MRCIVYDGRSARGWPADIDYEAQTLNIAFDAGPRESLPADDLICDVAKPGRTVLHRRNYPDWRLVIDAPEPPTWIAELKRRGRPGRRSVIIYGAASLTAVALGAAIWFSGDALIALGARAIPHRAMVPLGRAVISTIGNGKHCDAAGGQAALDRLVARLRPPSGFVEPLSVFVIDSPTINAFAVPGGQIVLLRGLIDKAEGPDEVAGILAHEITHVQLRHPVKMLLRTAGISMVIQSLGGNVGQVADFAVARAGSREAERAADGGALVLLKHAQISPAGMGAFFARMESKASEKKPTDTVQSALDTLGSFASTHPGHGERLSAIRQADSENWPATAAMPDEDWKALREICASDDSDDD